MGKLTIQDIAAILVEKNGFEKKDAKVFVSHMFNLIQEYLETDHQVKVKGLGTFKKIDVEPRESVSVRTGERVIIQGHAKVSFTPDATMKELVNKPFSQFETVVLNDGVEFDDLKNDAEDDVPADDVEQPIDELEPTMGDVEQSEDELVIEDNTLITEEPKEESQKTDEPGEIENAEDVESPQETGESAKTEELQEETPITMLEPQIELSSDDTEEEESTEVEAAGVVSEKVESVDEVSDKVEPVEELSEKVVTVDEEAVDVESAGENSEKVEPVEEESTTIEFIDEESHDDDSVDIQGNKRLWRWLGGLGIVLLLALSSVGGYYYGTLQHARKTKQVNETTIAQPVDTVVKKAAVEKPELQVAEYDSASTLVKTQDTVATKAVTQSSPTDSKVGAVQEKPKSQTIQETSKSQTIKEISRSQTIHEKPIVESVDQYAQKDERVRLGAYRIVGLEREVKVLAGQTFYSICKAHLGPDMECYVEVYNNLPRNPKIKVGQTIKIPKLQLKKRRK